MGMGFKFQMGMGMGMKSLKWEGIGTKNLFPHTSSLLAKFDAVNLLKQGGTVSRRITDYSNST